MIKVGDRIFVLFKCAPQVVPYSCSWLKKHDETNGGPRRVRLNGSRSKSGYWKDELEAWLQSSVVAA
jgi:hypothetical protein